MSPEIGDAAQLTARKNENNISHEELSVDVEKCMIIADVSDELPCKPLQVGHDLENVRDSPELDKEEVEVPTTISRTMLVHNLNDGCVDSLAMSVVSGLTADSDSYLRFPRDTRAQLQAAYTDILEHVKRQVHTGCSCPVCIEQLDLPPFLQISSPVSPGACQQLPPSSEILNVNNLNDDNDDNDNTSKLSLDLTLRKNQSEKIALGCKENEDYSKIAAVHNFALPVVVEQGEHSNTDSIPNDTNDDTNFDDTGIVVNDYKSQVEQVSNDENLHVQEEKRSQQPSNKSYLSTASNSKREVASNHRQYVISMSRFQEDHPIDEEEKSNDNNTERDVIGSNSRDQTVQEWYDEDVDFDGKVPRTPSIFSPYLGSPDSKYESYAVRVDLSQDDKASEIALFSNERPHMRGFHCAWISFFITFFTWFALSPLLSEVALSLNLDKQAIWTSSIYGVAGTSICRVLMGPACDKFGARLCMCWTLFLSGIPTALIGLVENLPGLCALRLFIGVAGASFVACQYWTTCMFTKEVSGTANALVAGWGNLGGGVTQIVMGSILFPLFKWIYRKTGTQWAEGLGGSSIGNDRMLRGAGDFTRSVLSDVNEESNLVDADMTPSELAWRTVCIIPAIFSIVTSYYVYKHSDDSPKGNYHKQLKMNKIPVVSARTSLGCAARNWNTWILFIQYGCCFGVEITLNNAAALYFKSEFDLTTECAAAIASIFGWTNLIARGLGGFASDISSAKYGMRGRLGWQSLSLVLEGIIIMIFAHTKTLAGAISTMVIFSIFVQASEGSTYGIVPYVNSKFTGSVAGIIGAGGSVGGVVFSLLFKNFEDRKAFTYMGMAAILSSLLTLGIHIKGFDPVINCLHREVVLNANLNDNPSQEVVQNKTKTKSSPDISFDNVKETS